MDEDWSTQFRRAASRWFSYHVVRLFTVFHYDGAEPDIPDEAYGDALVVDKDGIQKGTITDLVESSFDDALSALGESLPQAVSDIVTAEGPFSRVLHVFYDIEGVFVLDQTGERFKLQGIRLTLLCQFEFLRSAERHYVYNHALVTLSTVTDPESGETRSIGSVEFPAEASGLPELKVFEWEPLSMRRWRRLSGALD